MLILILLLSEGRGGEAWESSSRTTPLRGAEDLRYCDLAHWGFQMTIRTVLVTPGTRSRTPAVRLRRQTHSGTVLITAGTRSRTPAVRLRRQTHSGTVLITSGTRSRTPAVRLRRQTNSGTVLIATGTRSRTPAVRLRRQTHSDTLTSPPPRWGSPGCKSRPAHPQGSLESSQTSRATCSRLLDNSRQDVDSVVMWR